jgi:hypothetical protein
LDVIQILQGLRLSKALSRGVVLSAMAHSFRLKEMGIYHDMKPFPLSNDGFTLSKTEFNNKQLIKHTY